MGLHFFSNIPSQPNPTLCSLSPLPLTEASHLYSHSARVAVPNKSLRRTKIFYVSKLIHDTRSVEVLTPSSVTQAVKMWNEKMVTLKYLWNPEISKPSNKQYYKNWNIWSQIWGQWSNHSAKSYSLFKKRRLYYVRLKSPLSRSY